MVSLVWESFPLAILNMSFIGNEFQGECSQAILQFYELIFV